MKLASCILTSRRPLTTSHFRGYLEPRPNTPFQEKLLIGFNTFFFGRKQRVVVNEKHSKWATVRSELLQASVVGPVFFIVFKTSMLKCVSPRLSFYADDSRLYRVVMNDDDAAKIQNDLDALRKGTQGKLLKINLKKSHNLMLTGGSERPAIKYTKRGEQSLISVICEKHLGVGVDSRLSFNEHIAKKVKQENTPVAIIKKGFLNITQDILRTLQSPSQTAPIQF